MHAGVLILLLLAVGAVGVVAQDANDLPPDGKRLKEAFDAGLERQTKPLRDRYVADLTRLLEQVTRAGRLNDALAIKAEIAAVNASAGMTVGLTLDVKNTRWVITEPGNPGRPPGWIELRENGVGASSWNADPYKWSVTGRTVVFQQADGRTWRFKFNPNNLEATSDPRDSDGEHRLIRFEKRL